MYIHCNTKKYTYIYIYIYKCTPLSTLPLTQVGPTPYMPYPAIQTPYTSAFNNVPSNMYRPPIMPSIYTNTNEIHWPNALITPAGTYAVWRPSNTGKYLYIECLYCI